MRLHILSVEIALGESTLLTGDAAGCTAFAGGGGAVVVGGGGGGGLGDPRTCGRWQPQPRPSEADTHDPFEFHPPVHRDGPARQSRLRQSACAGEPCEAAPREVERKASQGAAGGVRAGARGTARLRRATLWHRLCRELC